MISKERISYLESVLVAVKAHNDACESMCGIGDQEGVACGYRPYFPRRCPDCARDDMVCNDMGYRIDASLCAKKEST